MGASEMDGKTPVSGVVPLSRMVGDDAEDSKLLNVMASGAQNYLRCFPWCKDICEAYFGDGYGGIVAVFLFRIEPARAGVDEWLWVIFGDVPPAYLVTDMCETPFQALERYIDEISKWVELAKQGKSSKDVIPVYAPATIESAADVETRINLLREIIVPAFRQGETDRA
jgi:hypothetical protein